jgi:hypothetical protein
VSRHFLELAARAHAGFVLLGEHVEPSRRVRFYWHTVAANIVPRDQRSRMPCIRIAVLVEGSRKYAGGRRFWNISNPRAERASWKTVRGIPWELWPSEETSMLLGEHPDVVMLQPNDVAAVRVGLDAWFERGEALNLAATASPPK